MEKTFKFFIGFMFGEFNKNQEEPYKILEDMNEFLEETFDVGAELEYIFDDYDLEELDKKILKEYFK